MAMLYVRVNGKAIGPKPLTEEKVRYMLDKKQVDCTCQVSDDGVRWVAILDHPAFRNVNPPPPPPNPIPTNGGTQPPGNGGGRTGTGKGRRFWVPAAIGALVLALIVVHFARLAYTRDQIERVLAQDKAIGQRAARDLGLLDVVWDQSDFVGRIVSGMRGVVLTGCPADFRDAYLQHVEAWDEYRKVAESYGGWTGFVKGFFTGGISAVSAYREASAAQDGVSRTWGHVLTIAQKYGAKPPT